MERWKNVVGWEGLYVVSDEGRVMKRSGRILKTDKYAHGGYHKAELRREDGTWEREYVHTLVLTAFVKPRPVGMECRHLDGNPSNNRLDNLAWGTPEENQFDKLRHGTWKPKAPRAPCMHSGPRRKLSEKRFTALLLDRDAGMTQKALAKKYRVSKSTVEAICTGRCKHRGEPPLAAGYRRGLPILKRRGVSIQSPEERAHIDTTLIDANAAGNPG